MKLESLFLLLLSFSAFNSRAQDDDNHREFNKTICEYTLPPEKNGLTTTSFWVQPRIRIERWEKTATIILDIKAEQGTALNPNPSFIYSYNYDGVAYGNETLGFDVFNNLSTSRSGLTFEVMVTYGSQVWGWKKVDGMTNQFGPIDKNAKASEVYVRVKVVGVGAFSGISEIENAIRKRKSANGETNTKGNVKSTTKFPPNKSKDTKAAGTEKKHVIAANTTKTKQDSGIKEQENTSNNTSNTSEIPNNTSSQGKSTISLNGSKINGEAECFEGKMISFISEENYLLLGQNMSEGTTTINADYYSQACADCPAWQFQDLKKGITYVATNGTVTKSGHQISLSLTLINLLDILDTNAQKIKISATLTCGN